MKVFINVIVNWLKEIMLKLKNILLLNISLMRYPYSTVREGTSKSQLNGHFFKFLFLVKDVVHYGLNVLLSLLLALLITTFWAFRATYSI